MSEAILDYFMYNDVLYPIKDFEKFYKYSHPSAYEVIRIIDKTPLFLEEHFERLVHSTELIGNKLNFSFQDLKEKIMKIIIENKIENHNLKILLNSFDSPVPNLYLFFIETHYPEKKLYENGVKTITLKAERENPNAKVINQNLREESNKLIKETNSFEALLVNRENHITEGSRSNTFFIKDNTVFTAPLKEVLSGITRKRIISQCTNNNINVIETYININELNKYAAAFISGTSPKVLPICLIDKLEYDVTNPLLRKVMRIYDDEIEKYILKSN